jgi:hypothetical protein
MIPKGSYIIIQHVEPQVDGGRYPVKREVGDSVHVTAEIFREGHDALGAELLWRKESSKHWNRIPMLQTNAGLDLWEVSFQVEEIGMHEYKSQPIPTTLPPGCMIRARNMRRGRRWRAK